MLRVSADDAAAVDWLRDAGMTSRRGVDEVSELTEAQLTMLDGLGVRVHLAGEVSLS